MEDDDAQGTGGIVMVGENPGGIGSSLTAGASAGAVLGANNNKKFVFLGFPNMYQKKQC
jgi:hypothetical protein